MNNHVTEIKLWILNTSAIIFTLTDFQDMLKVLILLASFGYTARKWYLMEKNKNKNEE